MHLKKTLKSLFKLLPLLWLAACFTKEGEDKGMKVFHYPVAVKIKGIDPIQADDLYSGTEVSRVYDGLLEYHYLKRPFTLQGNLAQDLPTVSDDGLTYTFKIRPGVHFHDNKCFKNSIGRELVADDIRYTFMRNADPKENSKGWWMIDGKIKGLDDWRKNPDYSQDIEGLKVIDEHTFSFTLNEPFPQFLYALAMPFSFIVPRECVEHYGQEFLNHPVGTGPYTLDTFNQSNKIVYQRNKKFRDKFYPTEAAEEFVKRGLLKDAGKKLPFFDKIVVEVMVESQPRWLKFQDGKIDFIAIPKDNFSSVLTSEMELTDEMKQKEIELLIEPSQDVSYTAFNHDLPLFQNKKLRQALAMATNGDEYNKLFFNGTALVAQSIVPPGLAGYDEKFQNPYRQYNLEKAKKLLAEAGYPEGKGLPEITLDGTNSTDARQMAEFTKMSLEKLGLKIKTIQNPWPELQNKIKLRKGMMHSIAWLADYPDAESFFAILYGPNGSPGANGSNYNDPVFNKMVKEASTMQDSPERTALYTKMNRYIAEEVPVIFELHRTSVVVQHAWIKNFVVGDFAHDRSMYINVDTKQKERLLEEKF